MTPLPARSAPSVAADGRSGSTSTRMPTTAGSTRRTWLGSGETWEGSRRRSTSRGAAGGAAGKATPPRPPPRHGGTRPPLADTPPPPVPPLGPPADVVDLALPAPAEHQIDRRAVVEHVEPVAHVLAVAVERQRLVLERVGDEERDDLLRVLVGPEVVAAAGDEHREVVGGPVRAHQQVGGGLGGRVGVRRGQDVTLAGGALGDAPVDLVGAHREESAHPELAGGLQQGES